MTAVPALVFPGSRSLATWWRQLASLQPRALWVGHLLLHRIEALAALRLLSPLERISLFVLKGLALTASGSLPELDERLRLGLPLLRQLLRQLEHERLVQARAVESWSLTELGHQALEQGSYPQTRQERRVFYFVESEQPARPPHFLNFSHPPAALPWPAGAGWRFESSNLQACLDKPAEWKQRFGFSREVEQILVGETADLAAPHSPQEWQRIIVDRPERLCAALILQPANERRERFVGFAVQSEGWTLQSDAPAFALEEDWHEVFPNLARDLALEDWQHAWRAWCQPRGLPPAEVDACVLERQSYRLRVRAIPRLVERLRAARSDVFKGEAWLLAGTGRLRAAAQIELVENNRERITQTTSGKA